MEIGNEGGFVLVGAMLILLLLTLIGISALNTTNMEIQIGGNDRARKGTFSQADGGTQLGVRLVEENLGSNRIFTALTANVLNNSNNTVLITTPNLAQNTLPRLPTEGPPIIRDAAFFPEGFNAALPNNIHTNITMSGVTQVAAGSGLQMVAGYEGKGKGTAGGGGEILYTISSQHLGMAASESVVQAVWRHIIGLELAGRY